MRIDWQMYDDGDFGLDATKLAEEALRDDPAARAELEGLRAFKRAVRDAALAEPVPVKSMERKLVGITGRRPSTRWQTRAVAALAALLAIGLVYAGASAVMWANPVIERRAEFTDLSSAITWAVERSEIPVPAFEEAGVGTFTSVHAARGRACFDFLSGGKSVHVTVTRGKVLKFGKPPVSNETGRVYIRPGTETARFAASGVLFIVDGGDRSTNLSVSQGILRQLPD